MATVIGTSGNDTGITALFGTVLNDTILGLGGEDIINAYEGDDLIITGAGGSDAIDGGAGIDTLVLSGSVDDYTVTSDGPNLVLTSTSGVIETVTGVELIVFDDLVVRIVGGGSEYTTIQSAIDASSDGDTIYVAAGTYQEDVQFNESVTVLGAQNGMSGSDGARDAAAGAGETTIIGHCDITAAGPVTLDGLRFVNDATTTGGGASNPTLSITSGYDHTITNSIFWSTVAGGANGVDDRAISLVTLAAGQITIVSNLISGSSDGRYGTASWGRGIWFDGAGDDLVVTDNTFTHTRTAINIDMAGDSTAEISNNAFEDAGTGLSVGVDLDGVNIDGNTFVSVDTDLNLRNLLDASIDLASAVSDAPGDGFVVTLGGNGADTITGTQFNDAIDGNNFSASATDIDVLHGQDGGDQLFGKGGADELYGDAGNDTLNGGAGDDLLTGGEGDDALIGGGGNDTALFSGDAADYSITIDGAGNLIVTDNNAEDVDEGGDTLTGVGTLAFADHNVLIVDATGTAGSFTSLQAAIDAAADGDTILVFPGDYTESANYNPTTNANDPAFTNPLGLLVNRSVSIIGVDADGTPITDPSLTEANIISDVQSNWGTNFFVTAPGVTISGLTFVGSDNGGGEINKVIEIIADNFTLTASVVTGPVGVAIASTIYVNDEVVTGDPAAWVSNISSFTITGNILEGDFVLANGAGFGVDDPQLLLADNSFVLHDGTPEDYNWGVIITGLMAGIPWRLASVGPLTVTGNEFAADYSTDRLLYVRDDDPANMPDAQFVQDFIAENRIGTFAYATTDGSTPSLYDIQSTNPYGAGDVDSHGFVMALTAGNASQYASSGDTLLVQSGADDTLQTILTDDLTVDALVGSDDLNLELGAGVATLSLAGAQNIDVTGNDDANVITGNDGANTLYGGGGSDMLGGAGGNDMLYGGAASDVLLGGEGDDTLNGGLGTDLHYGGAGDDTFALTESVAGDLDIMNGGADVDTADYSGFASAVWVSLTYAGSAIYAPVEAWTMDRSTLSGGTWRAIGDLDGIENLIGTAGNDLLYGDANDNVLGYTGSVAGGYDRLNGRDGSDTADFSQFGSAVWVDLQYAGVEAWTMDQQTLTGGTWRRIADLTDIEHLTGTAYADQLYGNSADNLLTGGAGNDRLTGRAGGDSFAFADAFGQDVITDWQDTGSGFEDLLDLRNVTSVHSFDDIAGSIAYGANAVITIGSDTITLTGVTSGLDAADFLFA